MWNLTSACEGKEGAEPEALFCFTSPLQSDCGSACRPEKMRLGTLGRTDRCVVAGAVAAIIHAAFLWPSLFSEEAENGTAENSGDRDPLRLIIGKNAAIERRAEHFWP